MSHDQITIRNHSNAVGAIAAMYDSKPDKEVDKLVKLRGAANTMLADLNQGDAPTQLPVVAKLEDYVQETATRRLARREGIGVLQEILERLEFQIAQALHARIPDLAATVKARFDTAAVELADLAPSVPLEMTAGSSTDDFAAHTRALALVEDLKRALHAHVTMAGILGENPGNPAWHILSPHDQVSVGTIEELLQASEAPTTLEDWLQLTAVGVELAQPGQAESRASKYNQAKFSVGYSQPDGGRHNASRTFAEFMHLGGQRSAPIIPNGEVLDFN